MNVAQIIAAKRDGKILDDQDISRLVAGYSDHSVPDYQMSAFAMAVYFQGMTTHETAVFTRCMVDSGERLEWPSDHTIVDKHSTGGIGDKVSIALAPLLACCGVKVPKISGRGLGVTGGTLDKMESIKGYRTELTIEEFRAIVNDNGCSIAGASQNLAPADKRLYALRDVTGTVPSPPLITASILSKKFAEGLDSLILDIKWGTGAFMKTIDQARQLAELMVHVGNEMGVKTSALITDMNQPLGNMIGNSVEINEAIEVLRGVGPSDVMDVVFSLASRLLVQSGVHLNLEDSQQKLRQLIDSGEALDRLNSMVKSHGGDLHAERPVAKKTPLHITQSGFIQAVHAHQLGLAIIEMGGGRKQMGDPIDHSIGIEFLVRIGDRVEPDKPIANIFCDGPAAKHAAELIESSITLSPDPVDS
ncbi:thymidine phosphorylase, partial [Mariniblastus sp.]|nr:thymidine phosphorylase [Mariniblastus sp.]